MGGGISLLFGLPSGSGETELEAVTGDKERKDAGLDPEATVGMLRNHQVQDI